MREEYRVIAVCLVTLTVFSGIMGMLAYVTPTTRFVPWTLRSTEPDQKWAGYAVYNQPGEVTDVYGQWVVPSVSGNNWLKLFEADVWVGLDGYGSPTVEQIGTSSVVVLFGFVDYYAWYEMYPSPPVMITTPDFCPVRPGDQMQADVYYTGIQNQFYLAITDVTVGWTFHTLQTPPSGSTALRSSGEWIVEASLANLANFGTVTFTNCYFGGNGFEGLPISSAQMAGLWCDQINMVNSNGVVRASTSGLLNSGTSFTVTWQNY